MTLRSLSQDPVPIRESKGWPLSPEPRTNEEWKQLAPIICANNTFDTAFGLGQTLLQKEWEAKGSPPPGSRFTQHLTLSSFPRLMANPAAVAAVVEMSNRAQTGEPPDFIVEWIFAFGFIWSFIPELADAFRARRLSGEIPQDLVDEIGTVLLAWLNQTEAHVGAPEVERDIQWVIRDYRKNHGFKAPLPNIIEASRTRIHFQIGLFREQIAELVAPVGDSNTLPSA
jgi:hypothetical protein